MVKPLEVEHLAFALMEQGRKHFGKHGSVQWLRYAWMQVDARIELSGKQGFQIIGASGEMKHLTSKLEAKSAIWALGKVS